MESHNKKIAIFKSLYEKMPIHNSLETEVQEKLLQLMRQMKCLSSFK